MGPLVETSTNFKSTAEKGDCKAVLRVSALPDNTYGNLDGESGIMKLLGHEPGLSITV